MIKLHGFAVSNYYNMVRFMLLEKGVEHELVMAYPSQEPEFLAMSPRGLVPFIETEHGYISETNAIFEYLEQEFPGFALLPVGAFERAKVREITRMIELYIEQPAHRLIGELIFNQLASDETKKQVEASLEKGLAAMARLISFSPYVCGEKLTIADIYFYYSFNLANKVSQKLFDKDLLGQLNGAQALFDLLGQSPHVQQINQDSKAAFSAFMAR